MENIPRKVGDRPALGGEPPANQEIEVTPEMVRAAEAIFADWKSENHEVLVELGGLGDVGALVTRLFRLSPYFARSSLETDNSI